MKSDHVREWERHSLKLIEREINEKLCNTSHTRMN